MEWDEYDTDFIEANLAKMKQLLAETPASSVFERRGFESRIPMLEKILADRAAQNGRPAGGDK